MLISPSQHPPDGGGIPDLPRSPGSRRFPASSLADAGLPAAVEALLVEVVADGFVVYCCGEPAAPHAMVAAYEWDHYLDVITIRSFERVTTARVPKHATVDLFAPKVVVWAYEGPPQQALRAMVNLVHPDHPDAPTTAYPAPPSLHIPRAQRRPMTIRPPSPGRAGHRAARLAAALTRPGNERIPPPAAVRTAING
ncbi:MAG: hypothetical protein ACRDQU_07620 [Pseudonocardiaceae bacterium]